MTQNWHTVLAAFLAACVAIAARPALASDAPIQQQPAPICTIDGRAVAVLDGDSLIVDGVEWRLIGYDAPEIERAQCEGERRTGIHAREQLARLIADAVRDRVPMTLEDTGERDRHRRPLARMTIGGRAIADIMVETLHARHYNGGRKKGWCSRDSRDDLVPGPPPVRSLKWGGG